MGVIRALLLVNIKTVNGGRNSTRNNRRIKFNNHTIATSTVLPIVVAHYIDFDVLWIQRGKRNI